MPQGDDDEQTYDKPKSSKRKRWEVKSKESFETSLALAVDSPCRNYYRERPKTSRSAVSKKKKNIQSNKDVQPEDDVSAKLSELLDDAQDLSMKKGQPLQLRDSEENLIESELKNYFNTPQYGFNPSAPPMSPEEMVPKTPKKKVSMKVTPIHSGTDVMNSKITEQLKQLHEDIIDNRRAMNNETTVPAIAVSGLLLGPSTSTFNGNVSTIYCERFNNFVMSPGNNFKNNKEPPQENKNTRISHAIQLQTGFRTFTVLCQGILSGFSIAHCLMIFLLQDNIDVLLHKNGLEYTFYISISILSTVCLVAAFDRNDLAGTGVFSEDGIKIPWNPLLYSLLVTLNLIIIRAEDFITHYEDDETHYKKQVLIHWWKFMCLSRTIFSILAWIGIVSDPHTDALNDRMKELSAE